MKAVIMAGGFGTRLYPMTKVVNKHLLPVYNKPMIYYSLSLPLLTKIKDILRISEEDSIQQYSQLFGDGNKFGISIEYTTQEKPRGISEGLIIAEDYLDNNSVMLVLGDNVMYGHGLPSLLRKARDIVESKGGGVIFGYPVEDPQRYGVVDFDDNMNVISIEEKPKNPRTNYAIPGVYFFDSSAPKRAKKLKPSKRGELEITDLQKSYLKDKKLKLMLLGRGVAWLDTGTPESLSDANLFIKTLEERTGIMISCIEEICYNNGWLSKDELVKRSEELKNTKYSEYLLKVAKDVIR